MTRRRKSFAATDGFDAVDLVRYAHGHLKASQTLFRADFLCLDSAGYLGHLALELLLKAGILYHARAFEDDHDLGNLRERLENLQGKLQLTSGEESTFHIFGQYAALRYPKPDDPIGVGSEEADGLFHLGNAIFLQLPAALIDAFAAANQHEKGGRVLMVKPIDPSAT